MSPDSLFHAAVLAGLVLLVRVMIGGVEVRGRRQLSAGEKLRVRLGPALVGVFLLVAGLVGAIALPLGLPLKATTATALLAGLLVASVTKNLIVSAASNPASDHAFDPRYELQGVPGVVVEAIPAEGKGVVELRGTHGAPRALYTATAVDGKAILAGTEVVVERVEGRVAYVESWSVVERRL